MHVPKLLGAAHHQRPLSGKIWIQDGEIVGCGSRGTAWRSGFSEDSFLAHGTFETLPAEPNRPRTIFKSYNGLLLESAQALDEARERSPQADAQQASPLARVCRD